MDPKDMTDAELESQINDQTIQDAVKPADQTAKETGKDPDPKKDDKDPAPTKDKDPATDPDDKKDDKDPAPEKGTLPDGIKKLLEKKNEEKRLKNEALDTVKKQSDRIADLEKTIESLKNPSDDDKMSDEERSQKLAEAISRKSIAEEKKEEALEKTKSIDHIDEEKRTAEIGDFFTKNPELLANKEEIMDIANNYPTLPMDQVNKLFIANTDPTKLLSEQEVNKIKGGFNLAGKFDRSKVDGKDPTKMTDDELEKSLSDTFAGGGKIL